MASRNRLIALSVAIMAASLVGIANGQARGRRAMRQNATPPTMGLDGQHAAQKVADPVMIENHGFVSGFTPPQPWVDVLSSIIPPNAALYQNMATLISGYTAVPVDRTNYYSAYVGNLGGWSGSVSNVVPQGGGGYIVTVLVDAILSDSSIPMADYSEVYTVDAANNVTYTGYLDPNGWAGLNMGVAQD